MTFSFIVPVYNAEKYLGKCIDSMLAQTHPDFEIILVNDGSTDNSQAVMDRYAAAYPDKISAFAKENGGAADARNYGICHATNEYLLFIDSDDYISPKLLSELNNSLCQCEADVIRYCVLTVFENGDYGEKLWAPEMCGVSGEEALSRLIDHKQYFDGACFCAVKRKYWQAQGFRFATGRYHEDFGLIPEVIMKAASFSSIDHVGYFYAQTPVSTMRTANKQKDIQRAFDGLYHFDHLLATSKESIKDETIRRKFHSYIANSMVIRLDYIPSSAKQQYLLELRKRKVFDLLLADTLPRKLKKLLIKWKYDRPVKE